MRLHLPPEYVLDKMEWYEVNALMQFQHYAHMDEWETTRFQSYMTMRANTNMKCTLQEFLPFEWEKHKDEEVDTAITSEQIAELERQAQQYIKANYTK